MKMALFVHDCFLEIGHSHAMVEILRNIPQEDVQRIDIVAFTCEDVEILFPKLKGKVFFRKVPFPRLYPFIFKVIFYHLYTYFFTVIAITKQTKKVGIGIASLTADIILSLIHI